MSTIASPVQTTWTLDPAHTSVEFSVRHLMITNVRGRFATFSGTLALGERPEDATVRAEIDAASIDTRVAQRDEHLRSADFFDVTQFPTLTFVSRQVSREGEGRYRVLGDLTIRGVTREVALEVSEQGRQIDPWGGERIAYEATTRIKRSDYGLTWNQVLEAGGVAVGDDVKISIDAQLVRQ